MKKILAPALVSLALVASVQAQDVLIVAAASNLGTTACEFTDVQQKIAGTGMFDAVDIFDAGIGTPTLAQLIQYESLFVFSNDTFFDRDALGDVLADYVDAGGGVVECIPTNSIRQVPIVGGNYEKIPFL